eukprot:CAMPEP_0115486672 /NCGR_PEP_ID=MMETSP0271-20121206/60553_1 /TAXON_ID=71861 /ORGANISM="Scrippsiella trochoidea, Strain CCMP3099" /LENGTH=94 /DNA_ID=CAMNT_0002914683 /DNA_START=314 /DNA_END=595 /DNA_ORIENTATION=+
MLDRDSTLLAEGRRLPMPLRRPLGLVNLRHVLDQVHNAARVAPLVVVPSDQLHEGRVQHDASLGIEGAGDGACLEVRGHQGLIAIAQEALHVAL